MELTDKQKNHLLSLIGEGLKTREINQRAALFKPPYKVSRQQVDFYRDTRGVKLAEITEASESEALRTGLALKEGRVETLNELGLLLKRELLSEQKLWLRREKAIGSGMATKFIEEEDFNLTELNALRAVLDDIAKEMNGRSYQTKEIPADPEDEEEDTGELKITVEYESVKTTDTA